MGVGNAKNFEQALDLAILAAAPMQVVEHRVRLRRQCGDQHWNVALHVDDGDVVAGFV